MFESICLWHLLTIVLRFCVVLQIEDYNEPFLDALSEYDDGRDLSKYNFNDGFGFPYDDWNKRKLAYRHRSIAEKYSQVLLEASFYFSVYSCKTVSIYQ